MSDLAGTKTNKERLKEITDGIEQGIKELFQSDRYRQYLSVMSRFHRYSVNNTMLIYLQRPDASLVAGYEKWKNQFGRHVKQGEHGITIIAPTPFKKKIEEVKLDPDTKAPLLDQDGKEIMEEKEISIPMFKPVKVFDVAQTDGKPLPQLAEALTGSVEQYEVFTEALHRSSPVPIFFKSLGPNLDGYFSPGDQAITIREGMSQIQTVSAIPAIRPGAGDGPGRTHCGRNADRSGRSPPGKRPRDVPSHAHSHAGMGQRERFFALSYHGTGRAGLARGLRSAASAGCDPGGKGNRRIGRNRHYPGGRLVQV